MGFGITYGDLVKFAAIFLFWWWVGKQVDRAASRKRGWKEASTNAAIRIVYWLLAVCALAALTLGVIASVDVILHWRAYQGAMNSRHFLFSILVWSTLLLAYSALELRRDHRLRRGMTG